GAAFLQLALGVLQDALLLEEGLVLLFEAVLALVEAAFLLAHFAADALVVLVQFFAAPEQVIPGLQFGLFLDLLGLVARIDGDALGLLVDAVEAEAVQQARTAIAQ